MWIWPGLGPLRTVYWSWGLERKVVLLLLLDDEEEEVVVMEMFTREKVESSTWFGRRL